jgi:hypothetical protein
MTPVKHGARHSESGMGMLRVSAFTHHSPLVESHHPALCCGQRPAGFRQAHQFPRL